MRSLLPLLLLLAAACTIDLPVGRVQNSGSSPDSGSAPDSGSDQGQDAAPEDTGTPDAGGDPDTGTADAGTPEHTLQVGSSPSIMCADSLGGREIDFAFLAPSDASLAGGAVRVHITSSSLILEGPLLEPAFQTTELVLRENVVPDQPAGTYIEAVPISGGPTGPDATQLDLAAMFVDTLSAPPNGEAGFEYATANGDGSCFVSFSIILLQP